MLDISFQKIEALQGILGLRFLRKGRQISKNGCFSSLSGLLSLSFIRLPCLTEILLRRCGFFLTLGSSAASWLGLFFCSVLLPEIQRISGPLDYQLGI